MTERNTGGNERMPLSALNGATLKYEDSDGNIHRVEFDDFRSQDTEG
jgi:hypothetical protein